MRLWLGLALLALSSVAPASPASERSAIHSTISRMESAWNRGDFRGYMAGFKNPDVIFVSGGKFQDGWQGTLDHYVRDYGTSAATRGPSVGRVAVAVRAFGDQAETGVLHPPDRPRWKIEIARVDEIVSRIDPHHRHFDCLQSWPRIVGPRRIHLVDEIIGIEHLERAFDLADGKGARRIAGRILRLVI